MAGSNIHFSKPGMSQTFDSSDDNGELANTFTVPTGVKMLSVLGIGAGAGGAATTDLTQGAGSGKIHNIFAPVTPGETVTITIGAGGNGYLTAGFVAPVNGGHTIVETSSKTYYFFGGQVNSFDATGQEGELNLYGAQVGAQSIPGPGAAPGGEAGYENGGDAGGTFEDGTDGGIGAGGGATSDAGQNGGNGGEGLVILFWEEN